MKQIKKTNMPIKKRKAGRPAIKTVIKTEETVNHPSHYGGNSTYEVIKVCEAWGFDKDAYLFNVTKYIARAGKKNKQAEIEDLKKAAFYLNRKIQNLENQ